MKSTLSIVCAAFAAVSTLSAQTEPAKPAAASAEAVTTAPMDKVSYQIGRDIGGQIAQQGDKLDLASFIEGIEDAVAGKKPSYAMGAGLGQRFANDGIPIDMAKLKEGIAFGTKKSTDKPAYTDEELAAAMDLFQKYLQEKERSKMTPEERAAEESAMKEMMASTKAAKEEGEKFLAENGKRKEVTTTASGLQYEILKVGTGPKPTAADTVKANYSGTLVNGTVFDSSATHGGPIDFALSRVIPGWTEGIQLMPVGSKWKLFIPSDLAYGPKGSPPNIRPNEALIFEVELIGIAGK